MKIAGKALASLLVVFSVFSYLVSLALGPFLFFFTTDGLEAASRMVSELPIDLFMAITIPVPVVVSYGVLFIAIWAVFTLCLILAWFSRDGFPNTMKNALMPSLSLAKTNFLFMMPLAASASLYASILLQQFQETQGIQTGSLVLPPNPYVILLNLAFAPLREEFAFRITSIGIPVGVFLVYTHRYDSRVQHWKNRVMLILLAMLSPERAKAKMGYRNVSSNGFIKGISPLEWALILLTSLTFGLAHYLLGGGWQVGKITTAFLAGLVFAILFVSYGAYAPILLHWFFNYYFTVLDMANSTYGGTFRVLSDVVEYTNLAAGQIVMVIFLLVSAYKLADYLTLRVAGLHGSETSG